MKITKKEAEWLRKRLSRRLHLYESYFPDRVRQTLQKAVALPFWKAVRHLRDDADWGEPYECALIIRKEVGIEDNPFCYSNPQEIVLTGRGARAFLCIFESLRGDLTEALTSGSGGVVEFESHDRGALTMSMLLSWLKDQGCAVPRVRRKGRKIGKAAADGGA